MVDVTNTTNVKVRFKGGATNVYTNGNTNFNETYATFLRIGDT